MPGPVSDKMTNSMCISYCNENNFTLAGTEYGTQCFCGNALADSYLLDDTACNMTCIGGPSDTCGGPWALSLFSPNREVPQAQGPAGQFTLANTPGGQHPGGVRQTILPIVTQVFAWPAPPALSSSPTAAPNVISNPDIAGLQSTMSSIIAQAMSEASQVVNSELAKATSVLGDAESVVSLGLSIIASDLSSLASGAETSIGPSSVAISIPSLTSVPLAPGPVVPSTPLTASIASSTSPLQTASAALPPIISRTPGTDATSTSITMMTPGTQVTANNSSTIVVTVSEASTAVGLRHRWHRRRAH